jgi:hypothetical protein
MWEVSMEGSHKGFMNDAAVLFSGTLIYTYQPSFIKTDLAIQILIEGYTCKGRQQSDLVSLPLFFKIRKIG